MSKEQMHSGITGVHLMTQVQATISSININLVVIPREWPHNSTHLMVNKPFKGQPNGCVLNGSLKGVVLKQNLPEC